MWHTHFEIGNAENNDLHTDDLYLRFCYVRNSIYSTVSTVMTTNVTNIYSLAGLQFLLGGQIWLYNQEKLVTVDFTV